MERYPENTTADIEDFRRSDWRTVIGSSQQRDYVGLWHSFSEAARGAIERENTSQGKVLWLLADACSMMLKPESANEPFAPFMVMQGRRSALPEDFQEQDVDLLAQISEEIDEPWLQARVADLVWLLKRPRSPFHALLAIDAYRQIPIDLETWVRDGRECWERAISLCLILRAGAGERIKEIESSIAAAFEAATTEDGALALWLSDVLLENGLGKDRRPAIAEKLLSLAQIFESQGDLYSARDFYEASAKWFRRLGDNSKVTELTVRIAETWVKEATAQSSHMAAASFYENAIQTYRTVPRAERAGYNVDEKLADLHRHLNEAGERTLDEMGVISSPTYDITEIIEGARKAIRGKSASDALFALANIHQGFQVEQLRERAERILREHPLQALLSATHYSRDGRVVAKRPGMETGDDGYKATVWAEMIKHFGMELGLVVQARIWPALEVAIQEHRLRERDFVSLASRSPIVPPGRAGLFGKALFAGYDRDFSGALHLLVPQIEHMVRRHLKAAGVKTSVLDQTGIENEAGLSTLMDLPEVGQIFGEDIAFEIKALFCDPFGPNLRNELAHGLLDEDQCESVNSIYAWWFGLKLVFNTFWNSLRKGGAPDGGEDAESAEGAEVEEEPS